MTHIEAFNVIVQVACLARITHQEHIALMQAIETLRKLVEPPPEPPKE